MFTPQVTVLFAGQQIPKSPFEVNVDKAQGDATKVVAKGPGLEPLGNIANKPTFFDIYTAGLTVQTWIWAHFLDKNKSWSHCTLCWSGAGVGDVTAVIKDPLGNKNTVEAIMEDMGESVFRCTYKPMQSGPHTINITFGGIAIPKSPFTVNIGPGISCNYMQTLPSVLFLSWQLLKCAVGGRKWNSLLVLSVNIALCS